MRDTAPRLPRRAVHIVDDDAQMRRAIWFMLESAGYAPRVFADGEDLLAELDYLPLAPLLSDLSMPGMDGLQLMSRVKARRPALPVIIITAHGDVSRAVEAMKAGAVDFIEKPFGMGELLGAVDAAAAMLEQNVEQDQALVDAALRIAELSAREREVLTCLAAGKSNKVIAFDLNLSVRTVEMHRVRMMRRLSVRSLPEALRLAHLGGLADRSGGAQAAGTQRKSRRAA